MSAVSIKAVDSKRDERVRSPEDSAFLAKRAGGTLATTLSVQALSLVSGALLARLLGVQNRGLLAAAILWPTVAAHVGDLGGPVANAYLAATKPNRITNLIANSFLLTAIQSGGLALLAAGIMAIFLRPYGDLIQAALLFLVFYLPANLWYRYLNYISLGRGAFTQFNAARLALQGSYVLGILLLFVFHSGDLRWVLAAYAVCHMVAAGVAMHGLLPFFSSRMRGSFTLLRETLGYGLRAHLGNLTPVEMLQLDLAVVIAFLGPREAGLYAVAASTGLIIRGYGGAVGTVALPYVASARDDETRRCRAGEVFRLSLILIVATAGVLLAAAGFLVPLFFGKQFSGAVPIVRILVVGMVAASLRQVLGDCLRGAGKPLAGTISEVLGWLIAIAGLALFVPVLGTIGAAVAVSLSYGATLVVSVAFARQIGLSIKQLFVPGRGDFSLAIGMAASRLGIAGK